MSRPNGRQRRAIEGLAAALQECLDASIESAGKRMEPRFEKIEGRLDKQDDTLGRQDDTLRRQNHTLRMIWTQCGGKADQRLPVDD